MKERRLIQVSPELGLAGGGAALVGRLIARSAAWYCENLGVDFEVLHLGEGVRLLRDLAVTNFEGRQLSMALALWACQTKRPHPALLFDALGPARLQAFLPRLVRSPYALFLHGIEMWRQLSWDRRKAVKNAEFCLTNSTHTLQRTTEWAPWLPKTHILPLALEDRPPAGKVDAQLLSRLGKGFLLIVGRMASLERYKGHGELLAAMPKVLAACPRAQLVVAGGGDDRERLTREAGTRGLGDSLTFTGFVSEATLAELYRRCAALVLPSRNEGFGLVYLEAMRAGKPCLALRRSAAEEIVVDGVTGLLVEPGDTVQLVKALVQLLSSAEMRSRLGEAGRKRWATQFTFDAFRNGLRPHLERLLVPASKNVRD